MAYLKKYDTAIMDTINSSFTLDHDEDGNYIFILNEGMGSDTEQKALNALRSVAKIKYGETKTQYEGADENATKALNDLANQLTEADDRQAINDMFYVSINNGHITFEPRQADANDEYLNDARSLLENRGYIVMPDGENENAFTVETAQQKEAIDFMNNTIQDPAAIKEQAEEISKDTQTEDDNLNATAELLSLHFMPNGNRLVAHPGTSDETINTIQEHVAPFFKTEKFEETDENGATLKGLAPLPDQEDLTQNLYDLMYLYNLARIAKTDMQNDPKKQAIANNIVAELNAADGEPTGQRAPITLAQQEIEQPEVYQYMNGIAQRLDRANNSDENEVMYDLLRFAALQATGDNIPDWGDMEDDERSLALDRALQRLPKERRREYEGHLNDAKTAILEMMPPKKLVEMRDALMANLAKKKLTQDQRDALNSQLKAVTNTMDTIVSNYVEGKTVVNQNNIADVYEGFSALLTVRGENPLAKRAEAMLNHEMEVYDINNGIVKLTPRDNARLEERAQAAKKALSDMTWSPDVRKMMESLEFVDENGNVVPQIDQNNKWLDGARDLRDLADIQTAQLLKELTFSNDELTPEYVQKRIDEMGEMSALALIAFDLASKGLDPKEAGNHLEALQKGTPYRLPQNSVMQMGAGFVNQYNGFVDRLSSKVGKESPVLKTLTEPVRAIDSLLEKRFGSNYVATKNFLRDLNRNSVTAAGWSAASKLVMAGASYAGLATTYLPFVGTAIAIARMGMNKRKEDARLIANGQKPQTFLQYVKSHPAQIGVTALTTTALAMGAWPIAVGAMALNAGYSMWKVNKEAKKDGASFLKRLGKMSLTIIPSVVALMTGVGTSYATDAVVSHLNPPAPEIGTSTSDTTTVQNNVNTDANEAAPTTGATVTTGTTTTADTTDAADTTGTSDTDTAPTGTSAQNETIPDAEPVLDANGNPIVINDDIPNAEPVLDENGNALMVVEHHDYPASAHEHAMARLEQRIPAPQLNAALEQMRALEQAHPELLASDGSSNADVYLYKLHELSLLAEPRTDIMAGGVRTEIGAEPFDLLKDIMAGRTPNGDAVGALRYAEDMISTRGHFNQDIVGFKEAGTISYRPGMDAGYVQTQQTYSVPVDQDHVTSADVAKGAYVEPAANKLDINTNLNDAFKGTIPAPQIGPDGIINTNLMDALQTTPPAMQLGPDGLPNVDLNEAFKETAPQVGSDGMINTNLMDALQTTPPAMQLGPDGLPNVDLNEAAANGAQAGVDTPDITDQLIHMQPSDPLPHVDAGMDITDQGFQFDPNRMMFFVPYFNWSESNDEFKDRIGALANPYKESKKEQTVEKQSSKDGANKTKSKEPQMGVQKDVAQPQTPTQQTVKAPYPAPKEKTTTFATSNQPYVTTNDGTTFNVDMKAKTAPKVDISFLGKNVEDGPNGQKYVNLAKTDKAALIAKSREQGKKVDVAQPQKPVIPTATDIVSTEKGTMEEAQTQTQMSTPKTDTSFKPTHEKGKVIKPMNPPSQSGNTGQSTDALSPSGSIFTIKKLKGGRNG